MVMDRVPGSNADDPVGDVPDIGNKGLYSGVEIDSQEEALASGPPAEPTDMMSDIQGATYTLGRWRIKPGQQADFIAAWQALGDIFRLLAQPPAGKGILVQDVSDPTIFYSFGPWLTLADVEAMRKDDKAKAGLDALRGYCTEGTTGVYRTVAEADIVRPGQQAIPRVQE